MNANEVIKKLDLMPLPEEGGFYRETHRASEKLNGRSIATHIYFLQTSNEFSAFHLLKTADEMWHFYSGDPIDLVIIDNQSGQAKHITLGPDISKGHVHQYMVPRGTWFASRLLEAGNWGLVCCTVTPAFEFDDFVIGKRDELLKKYPISEKEIIALTRK